MNPKAQRPGGVYSQTCWSDLEMLAFGIRKGVLRLTLLLLTPSCNRRTRGDLVKLTAGKFRINKKSHYAMCRSPVGFTATGGHRDKYCGCIIKTG